MHRGTMRKLYGYILIDGANNVYSVSEYTEFYWGKIVNSDWDKSCIMITQKENRRYRIRLIRDPIYI